MKYKNRIEYSIDVKPKVVCAIASFVPAEFELLRRTAADKSGLHDCYADWRKSVDELEAVMAGEGHEVVEVNLTVSEIETHCMRTANKNNGATRSEYAHQKLQRLARPAESS